MAYFNPADYEARRRRATQSFGATGAMNAYANFLSQQRGTSDRTNMMDQYNQGTTAGCCWLFSSWFGWP
jgi:aspartate/tyrosine/aromatic aminotransferase